MSPTRSASATTIGETRHCEVKWRCFRHRSPEAVQQTLAGTNGRSGRTVRAAFASTLAPSRSARVWRWWRWVALAASELFPHSDVDLLLLVETDKISRRARSSPRSCSACGTPACGPAIRCIRWRTASSNTPTTPSSPSACWTTASWPGTQALYQTHGRASSAQFQRPRGPGRGAPDSSRLAEARRAKFQNTIYHLEPNIKETPGGLRDLQTARWLHDLEPHGRTARSDRRRSCFLAGVRLPAA